MTRARLLETARRLFAQSGYAAVSRADVAKSAGVGMSTIYHHFPSKKGMLLELIDEWAESTPIHRGLLQGVQRSLQGDGRAATRDFLRHSYEYLKKRPSFYRVILTEAERDPEVRRRFQRAQRVVIDWTRKLIEDGQHGGIIRSDLEPEAGAYLIHHVREIMLTELVAQDLPRERAEAVIEELSEMLFRYSFRDASESGANGERPARETGRS